MLQKLKPWISAWSSTVQFVCALTIYFVREDCAPSPKFLWVVPLLASSTVLATIFLSWIELKGSESRKKSDSSQRDFSNGV